ncbi:hypothetical protein Bbelb_108810 [Branchiostoma belcheri]|nr:hypothetical protein Bbelb_108810 [Branchiostoma belcheri]
MKHTTIQRGQFPPSRANQPAMMDAPRGADSPATIYNCRGERPGLGPSIRGSGPSIIALFVHTVIGTAETPEPLVTFRVQPCGPVGGHIAALCFRDGVEIGNGNC